MTPRLEWGEVMHAEAILCAVPVADRAAGNL